MRRHTAPRRARVRDVVALPRVACTALVVAASMPLGAQSIAVRPLQDLTFGAVIPGVPVRIAPLDVVRGGQVEVQATRGTIFELRITLPNTMTGPGGTTLPLQFDGASAVAAANRNGNRGDLVTFNPRAPQRFQLVTSDRAVIYLGGEARPRAGQPVGRYAAPVVMTISNLSN